MSEGLATRRYDWRGNPITPEQAHRKLPKYRFCDRPTLQPTPGFGDALENIGGWVLEHPVATGVIIVGAYVVVTIATGGGDLIFLPAAGAAF